MKPLFAQRRSLVSRLFIVFLLAAALVAVDHLFNGLASVRYILGSISKPYYQISNAPQQLVSSVSEGWQSRESLVLENQRLKARERILKAKTQKLAALSAENGRLRALLNSSALLGDDDIVVAELIGISPDINRYELMINKGANDEVFVGQPVIDATGLVGQVTDVYQYSARVMLITDERHAVPVQINRNGLRAVVAGVGLPDELALMNVGATADIKQGDLLVSSGLGGRFPIGYPVARVSDIVQDGISPFLSVKTKPMAQLDRSRYLLLVFPDGNSQ